MPSRWSRFVPAFLIGLAVGVVGSVATHFLTALTVPFTERALNFPSNSHMKLFVQDASAFNGGWDDGDTAHTWFSFSTRIADPEEYFRRVDGSLSGTNWRLIDSHPTFRLYVSPWARGERKEIAIRIALSRNEVFFEQQRRYDGSAR